MKNECNLYIIIRRNPSGGSGLSETGSLDRAKAALERRKKAEDGAGNPILCRVEVTRPNPDSLIDELLKATNLEQTDLESSESMFFFSNLLYLLYTLKDDSYRKYNGEFCVFCSIGSFFLIFYWKVRIIEKKDCKFYK